MLNTEIGKTGEVIVEGHVIGRLDGFTFAPEVAEAGSDAKALQATAQKALAGEIDARAEKLAAAPDDHFVLTSDGTMRWTGDAVARLMASDDALHPRIRVISDERLSGAPREAVQARLDLWLKTHIEKLLGPLFELGKAEDVTGIARGIAFQLIEALGVLERARIASEMKDLDQPSRASLRKYGVRFGAYHIYIPALLKPAARSLASLLWVQKRDNVDLSALSGVQALAASGRTSFPVDKALLRDAYRVLGYRQCGERAVRVDILERLADLIRPALAWRETSPGTKPPGAFDGRGFVVTQAMTSLTGSAGEDFASVLRALGYRMERRAPPPPKPVVVEAPAVETIAVETATAAADSAAEVSSEAANSNLAEAVALEAGTAAEAAQEAPSPADEAAASSASLLPSVGFAQTSSEPEPVVPSAPVLVEAERETEAAAGTVSETASVEEPVELLSGQAAPGPTAGEAPTGGEAVPAEASATAAAVAAEPELVEVWRPGGRADERRPPRHDRNRQRRHERSAGSAQPAPAGEIAVSEQGEGIKRERHRHGRRNRSHDFRKVGADQPADGTAAPSKDAPARKSREGGRPRERFEGKGRSEDRSKGKFRDRDNGGREKTAREGTRDRDKGGRESGPSHRQYASSASPRDRDRAIDPNSPFAKLAALREQLTANRKD
jgi:ATP-dependent RNA helicase SUPV3L1/SUV3